MKNDRKSRRSFLSGLLIAASSGLLYKNGSAFSIIGDSRPAGSPPGMAEPPDLNAWLSQNSNVRSAINWLTFTGAQSSAPINYVYWTPEQKADLKKAFEAAWNNQPAGLPETPPNMLTYMPDNAAATVLKPADAWAFYVAGVAASLAVETGKRVPWSVTSYSPDNLRIIFDSSWLFIRDVDTGTGYRIIANNNGYVTPAPPDLILNFLRAAGVYPPRGLRLPPRRLTEQDYRRAAIAKLFDWCRYNLIHAPGDMFTMKGMMDNWQYHGFPPVARVISGTMSEAYSIKDKKINWTGGCYGTTGFLGSVLRVINIPVKALLICGHSMPAFTSESLYLSHGDDLYGSFSSQTKDKPLPFPSMELLITQEQFNAWLAAGVADKCKNVARRPRELGLKYLPYHVVEAYCKDKQAGLSHANGQLYKMFSSHYTLQELESADLWGRLEKKVEQVGGCFVKF